jgi:hypothetical protein
MAASRRRRVGPTGALVERQGDALKELGLWSRWLVTVESALLAGIVAAGWLGGSLWCLLAALAAFALSLASATMVLGAIPDALQKLPIRVDGRADIYVFRFKGLTLRWWARGQHVLAGLGLAFILTWAVTAIWQAAERGAPNPAAGWRFDPGEAPRALDGSAACVAAQLSSPARR